MAEDNSAADLDEARVRVRRAGFLAASFLVTVFREREAVERLRRTPAYIPQRLRELVQQQDEEGAQEARQAEARRPFSLYKHCGPAGGAKEKRKRQVTEGEERF